MTTPLDPARIARCLVLAPPAPAVRATAPRAAPWATALWQLALWPLALLVASGCSTAPEAPTNSPVDELEVEKLPRKTRAELTKTADRALDEYTKVVYGPNDFRAEFQERHIEAFLAQLEADYRDDFFAMARDGSTPQNQAIAVAMLGFSPDGSALPTILSALGSNDEPVVANAVLALAVRKDPETPPATLARVIGDDDVRVEVRACAAWALHEIQRGSVHPDQIEAIWANLLGRPRGEVAPSILISAIRGVGLMRKPELAPLIETFIDHPTPKLREAACIALERIGWQDSWKAVVTRLEAAETNPNVRLAAQKALQALAGVEGDQYDAKAWRRVFERMRTTSR